MGEASPTTTTPGSRSPGPLSKRARELQQSEGVQYRSPSLSTSLAPPQPLFSDSTQALPTVLEVPPHLSSPPGLSKRPRAGTLPSTFHLGGLPSNPSLNLFGSGLLGPPLGNGTSASLPGSGAATPSDFPFSSHATSLVPPLTSRLRSGSLSTAFGHSVFGNDDTWAPRSSELVGNGPSKMADDGRSPESSTYGDDSHVRTLDYLGLDGDSPIGGVSPFSEKGLGSIGDAVIGGRNGGGSAFLNAPSMQRLGSAGNLPTSPELAAEAQRGRMRSNTVAAFRRPNDENSYLHPHPLGSTAFTAPPSSRGEEEDYLGHRSSESTDSSRLLYSTPAREDADSYNEATNGLHAKDATARARAATIGILDESREVFMRKRAGTTTGLTPHSVTMGGPLDQNSEYVGGAASVMVRGMRGLSIGQDDAQNWNSSRPMTPESHSLTPPLQQPTRSLWIGNLAPETSPAELQSIFAPYGAIESLRLIPEKECGFVNYVSVHDAVRAKEDVLNRLGGQLTKTSGMVRIGFGKADSAFVAPASGLSQSRNGGMAQELSLQSSPTRALWVGSIPPTTTPNQLLSIFSPFGPIESARVLTHKSCGFINYERLDDAVGARKALNNREILGPEVGVIRIGFAKVPTKLVSAPYDTTLPFDQGQMPPNGAVPVYNALRHIGGASSVPHDVQIHDGMLQDYRSNLLVGLVSNGNRAGAFRPDVPSMYSPANDELLIETVQATVSEAQVLMRDLDKEGADSNTHIKAVSEPRPPATYYGVIPQQVLSDPSLARRYGNADASRLRDIRKRLESNITVEEVDSIAFDLIDECVALASDYIGNTLIQKLFERASVKGRMALLDRIGPHLAAIGTHKNGTWAIQKIIQCVQSPEEFAVIEQNLQPFTPPLLLNDFGNYVVQGALRFGSPTSDFIFDAMIDRCWEIGSGRFGARSMRQTLESSLASRLNTKRVAVAIVLNSIPLATSSNGALLVTWLLDTSGFPGRYHLLAPRFAPHLVHLCTHKLASLSVLKIINQRVDPAASRMILDTLFADDSKVLEDILGDQVHGTSCITKIVASQYIDPAERAKMTEKVKDTLTTLKVTQVPAYRKLVEDIGLPYSPAPGEHSMSSYNSHSPSSYQHSPQTGTPIQQWAPNMGGAPGGYQPYGPYEYSPYPYGPYGAQFSQPYYPAPFFPGQPYQGPNTQSPMLSPLARPPPSSTGFSPMTQAASLPSVGSPDPFSSLRVTSGDMSGFNPAFSPPLYNPYGESR